MNYTFPKQNWIVYEILGALHITFISFWPDETKHKYFGIFKICIQIGLYIKKCKFNKAYLSEWDDEKREKKSTCVHSCLYTDHFFSIP